MDAAGAGSSSKPTPTRPHLAVRVRGRPSSILSRADPAEWRSRPAVSWTVENIYEDFSGRRRALVGALTQGKERMCLYGMRLFDMVNKISAVHDEFYRSYGTSWISTFAPPSRDITPNVYNPNRDSSAPAQENMYNPDVDSITPAEVNMLPYQDSMQGLSAPNKGSRKPAEDKGNDHEATDFCGVCSAYHANAFWICCDICDQWFHGKCVNITASESKHLEVFKCRDCILDEIGE
ncbi:hypothetical protein ZWY2020_006791 [Hordeum vulgare]|nr:hypothetical protein ZWY2020_006791 [Hordeum vulgare]